MLGSIGLILGGLGAVGGIAAIPYVGPVIAFFLSPVGRWVAVGLIVAAAYGYGWYKGDRSADAKCAAASARVELARKKVEASLERSAARSERETIAELKSQQQKSEEAISDLEARLKKEPTVVYSEDCRVPVPGPRPKRVR
jgi:hypothetical protein